MGNELKPHIGIFGRRNYGKSSLINFITGQQVAIVSSQPGTTTDPVRKSMEIAGIGPVVLIDTAGIDDEGTVGNMRIQKSADVLSQIDLALILFSDNRFESDESALVEACRSRQVPFLLVYSRADVAAPDNDFVAAVESRFHSTVFRLSVHDSSLRDPLLHAIAQSLPESAYRHPSLLADVVSSGDIVVLVAPIDSSAPEGRMILPQVQVLRDLLDNHAVAVVCQPAELPRTLDSLSRPPRLVVTDSQVYRQVSEMVPDEVFLTSFSVVLARAKGLFEQFLQGTPAIDTLSDGDRVLILESCTHNVTCEDIGRVKLPKLLQKYTKHNIVCDIVAGQSPIIRPISDYALVIQCGGCVITPRQVRSRIEPALLANVPVSNYGLAIAYMNGIFHRAIRIFQSFPTRP